MIEKTSLKKNLTNYGTHIVANKAERPASEYKSLKSQTIKKRLVPIKTELEEVVNV